MFLPIMMNVRFVGARGTHIFIILRGSQIGVYYRQGVFLDERVNKSYKWRSQVPLQLEKVHPLNVRNGPYSNKPHYNG
jgi:hypothetical protein